MRRSGVNGDRYWSKVWNGWLWGGWRIPEHCLWARCLFSLSAQFHHELVVDVGVAHRLDPIAGIDQHFVNVASIEEVESSFATYVQAVCYHNDYSGNLSPQYIISHSSISCGVTVSALVKCRNLSMASWLRKQIWLLGFLYPVPDSCDVWCRTLCRSRDFCVRRVPMVVPLLCLIRDKVPSCFLSF